MTFMTPDLEMPHFQGRGDMLGFPEQRIFSRTNPEMMCFMSAVRVKTPVYVLSLRQMAVFIY